MYVYRIIFVYQTISLLDITKLLMKFALTFLSICFICWFIFSLYICLFAITHLIVLILLGEYGLYLICGGFKADISTFILAADIPSILEMSLIWKPLVCQKYILFAIHTSSQCGSFLARSIISICKHLRILLLIMTTKLFYLDFFKTAVAE